MKVLAVDYGRRRVGLAVGDSQTRVATPLGQIASRKPAVVIDEILRRVGELEIESIVVGYPLNMDGSRGAACVEVERFVRSLGRRTALPIDLVDEKLTSFAAEEMGKEIQNDFRKRKAFLDSLAAQVILQNYFERP
jgi:putative Holliday junction resolvase